MRTLSEDMKAPYYKRVKGIHEKNKKTLIGFGVGANEKRGPFKTDRSMGKKAKSAPPGAAGGGSLEEEQEPQSGETIALFPGSFKPPHKGHLAVVDALSKMGANKVIVLISAPKVKTRSDISAEQVKEVFEIYANSADFNADVDFIVSPMPSPISAAYDFLEKNQFPLNSKVILATSTADSGRFPQDKLEKYAAKNPTNPSVSSEEIEQVIGDDGEKKVSASDMRAILEDPSADVSLLKKFMPDKLLNAEKQKVIDILTTKHSIEPTLQESLANRMFRELLSEFLEEKKEMICDSDCAMQHEGMSHEEHLIFEEKDRCYRIAKRKYDAFPSAYASGAIVKCRQGKIWKGIKESYTLKEAKGDNYQKALAYLKNKKYTIIERPPSDLVIKVSNGIERVEVKEKIEQDLQQLGFIFNPNTAGSGFGRFEKIDRQGDGNAYIYIKPPSGAASAGASYETEIAASVKNLLPSLEIVTAGSGHGSDLIIRSGDKQLSMELKTSSGADFGQFKIQYDLESNTWAPIKTKDFLKNKDLFQGLFDTVVSPAIQGKVIVTNAKDPAFNIKKDKEDEKNKIVGLKRSTGTGALKDQLQKMWFSDRKDMYLPIDKELIQTYYAGKHDSLICIQKKGIYALTDDAERFFGVPQLKNMIGGKDEEGGSGANIRFRIKPGMGTNGAHYFYCALKISLKPSGVKVTDQDFLSKVRNYLQQPVSESSSLEEIIKQELRKLIQEEKKKELICDGSMCNEVHKGVPHKHYLKKKELEEEKKKEDRCIRIAKRKYDAWPSAYASGAVVKCRQGKIWKGEK